VAYDACTHYGYLPRDNFADGTTEERKAEWYRTRTCMVPRKVWEAYSAHLDQARRWNRFWLKLDNMLYAREHPE
jgi:hypothetical protein